MSEQDRSGEALGQPAAPVEQVRTVESVVLDSTVEVSDPPEAMPQPPQSLRRDLGEKISDIFGRMGGPEDPEDELTDLEEKFRAGLRVEEEASEARLELLRQEGKDLAESNDHAFHVLRQRSSAIGEMDKRLTKGENDIAALDAELEKKKAHLALAHEALIKLGKKGGTAEEIEAVMAEIDAEAAEKLVAARHERRPQLALSAAEMAEPTRSFEPVAEQPGSVAHAEPTATVETPTNSIEHTDTKEPAEEQPATRPFDTTIDFKHPDDITVDGTVVEITARWPAADEVTQTQIGDRPAQTRHGETLTTFAPIDPANIRRHSNK